MKNPFKLNDPRHEIWNMLVERDIVAFCNADWSLVQNDFIDAGFMGLDAGKESNPDLWKISFPDLESYREAWLHQAHAFAKQAWTTDPVDSLHKLTSLAEIEINGDTALAHKKFDGKMNSANGGEHEFKWQTLYQCRKKDGKWKISGFVGYLPLLLGQQDKRVKKRMPAGAVQHKTAGPYSPVLEISADKLVVISGQASLDLEGNVIGQNIEDQTETTLSNCLAQLQKAGCTFEDVFKVNVYLKDLSDWPSFNVIYQKYFPDPKPVRTAVQTPLLMTFLVEIEMWAVK